MNDTLDNNNDNVYYANFGPIRGIQGVHTEKEAKTLGNYT
jgi:hypothetical protein